MTTESSERFWLAHPALREVGEAHRRGVVLYTGCVPLKHVGTVSSSACGNCCKYLSASERKHCCRNFRSLCEEMTVLLEAVNP